MLYRFFVVASIGNLVRRLDFHHSLCLITSTPARGLIRMVQYHLPARSIFEGESPSTDIIYPDSDGQPMSDNTKQYLWIVLIKEGIEWLFASDPNIFVAGDLLWYPVQGNNKIRIGPDVLVAFGRPKGHRGSYQQWKEDNIIPFG